ncbi:hypothetical protein Q3G72_014109 [Acer saccharum]|nr:hypothetical protein Q3G72_014109 [Acer saccharum]
MDKLTKWEEYMELVEKDPRLVVEIYEAYLSKQVDSIIWRCTKQRDEIICTRSVEKDFRCQSSIAFLHHRLKYGVTADGATDISKALLDAFRDACASPTPSKVLVP